MGRLRQRVDRLASRRNAYVLALLALTALSPYLGACAEKTPASPATNGDETGRRHWVVWVENQRVGRMDTDSTLKAFDLDAGRGRIIASSRSVKLHPLISDRWVVWLDGRDDPTPLAGGCETDLYCVDLATGKERRLTQGARIVEAPALAGDWVVWCEYPDPDEADEHVFEAPVTALDLRTGQRREFLVPGTWGWAPIVDGDLVAWWSLRTDPQTSDSCLQVEADLQVAELADGAPTTIDVGAAQHPMFTDSELTLRRPWLVWSQPQTINAAEVPDTTAETIVEVASRQQWLVGPAIAQNGDRVIWCQGRHDADGRGALWAADLPSGPPQRLCGAAPAYGRLQAAGDWVVWAGLLEPSGEEAVTVDTDILAYDLISGRRLVVCDAPGTQIDPQLCGHWVVWQDARHSPGEEVEQYKLYAYDLVSGEEIPVATDGGNKGWPSVSR